MTDFGFVDVIMIEDLKLLLPFTPKVEITSTAFPSNSKIKCMFYFNKQTCNNETILQYLFNPNFNLYFKLDDTHYYSVTCSK